MPEVALVELPPKKANHKARARLVYCGPGVGDMLDHRDLSGGETYPAYPGPERYHR